MKISDINSSLPGLNDFTVIYEGSNAYRSLGGDTKTLIITTEIRTNLNVQVSLRESVAGTTPQRQGDVGWGYELNANGEYIIRIPIPDGFTAYYRISGSKSIAETVNPEQTEEILGSAIPTKSHNHDGTNSEKILGTNLDVGLVNANKIVKVNSAGTAIEYVLPGSIEDVTAHYIWIQFKINAAGYAYDLNFGESGVVLYVPSTPNWVRMMYLTYCVDQGGGTVQTGQQVYSANPPVESLASGDRLSLNFEAPISADELNIYKNGILFYTFAGVTHPNPNLNAVYNIGFKYQSIL